MHVHADADTHTHAHMSHAHAFTKTHTNAHTRDQILFSSSRCLSPFLSRFCSRTLHKQTHGPLLTRTPSNKNTFNHTHTLRYTRERHKCNTNRAINRVAC